MMPEGRTAAPQRSLLQRAHRAYANAAKHILPAFKRDVVRDVPPERARAVVVSFYMANMPAEVVAAQRDVLIRLTPDNVAIVQVRTRLRHDDSIDLFLSRSPYRAFVILDIDCVPVSATAIADLLTRAEAGALAGAVQRTNHKQNDAHLFVAPSCLAMTRETYDALGRPSFRKTQRGDVAEEVTYVAEQRSVPVDFLWPTHSEDAIWELRDGMRYGHGTTFEKAFWHAFEIRHPEHHRRFITHCEDILRGAA
jgi:hypothetical protein